MPFGEFCGIIPVMSIQFFYLTLQSTDDLEKFIGC